MTMSVAAIRSLAVLALAALLAGCAGSVSGTAWPGQFVGRPLGEAIAAYGRDYRCATQGAARTRVTWRYMAPGVTRGRDEPATPAVTPDGIGVMPGRHAMPRSMRVQCRLSFLVDNARRVISWRMDGDVSSSPMVTAMPLSVSSLHSPTPVAGAEACLAAVATLRRPAGSRIGGAAKPAALECAKHAADDPASNSVSP